MSASIIRSPYPSAAGAPDFDLSPYSPRLWLAPDDLVGFVDNDPIGGTGDEWPNLGAAGGNFTQPTLGQRPLYKENVQNGLPVARFSNVTDPDRIGGANMSSYASVSAYTLAVVIRPGLAGGTDGSNRYWRRPRVIADGNLNLVLSLYNSQFRISHNTTGGPSVATPSFSVGSWYVVVVRFGSGNLSITANNSTPATASGAANITTLASATTIGNGTDAFLDADLGDIFLTNTDIGSTNAGTLQTGLAGKWNITLLP